MFRPILAGAALVALVVGSVGCGGSDSSSTTTKTVTVESVKPLSRAEWVKQADAICSDYEEKYANAEQEFDKAKQEPESEEKRHKLAELFDLAGDAGRELVAELRKLPAAPADSEVTEEFLRVLDDDVDLTKELATPLEDNDVAAVEDLIPKYEQNSAKEEGLAKGWACSTVAKRDSR